MSEITPLIDERSAEPLYAQLYRFFRTEIQRGRLAARTRLPSVRHLSQSIRVSKITVETAYQQLLAEGYIESRARSGYFVVEIEGEVSLPERSTALSDSLTRAIAEEAKLLPSTPIRYHFHNTRIDNRSFPTSLWRKCTMEAFEAFPADFVSYGHKQGEPELRAEIAKYLHRARTVNCAPEQIVLGSGLLNSLSLLCLLLQPTVNKVAMEEPGYVDARVVFEQHGMEVVPIALEADGLDVDQLWQSGAQLVYVTPSHQYPHGMVMPIAKRLQLLEWARTTGGLIFENDYDGEFRYNAKPTPSLQGLDTHGSVVFAGDVTKSFSPAMRMHYMILPPKLLHLYHQPEFHMYNCPVPRLTQRAMQLFMQKGHWEKHIRKMRKVYERKHKVLLEAVHEHLHEHVTIMAQSAGLHILLEIKTVQTEEELTLAAAHAGIKVYPIGKNWINRDEWRRPRFIIGFGGLTVEEIREGIELLGRTWFPEYELE